MKNLHNFYNFENEVAIPPAAVLIKMYLSGLKSEPSLTLKKIFLFSDLAALTRIRHYPPTAGLTGAYLPTSRVNKHLLLALFTRPPCIISLIHPAAGSIASAF